jgi:TonB family protein
MLLSILMAGAALAANVDGAKPAERARANLGSYFSTDDYPAAALRRRGEGTVKFQLEIDPGGRVSNCTVTDSSGDTDLDEATCAILRERVRYAPAQDLEGRATVGTDQGSVTWRLPADDGSHNPPFSPLQLVSTMHRTAAGAVTCNFAVDGRPTQLDARSQCATFQGSGAEAALQGIGAEAELIQIFTILPAGGTPSGGATPQGEIIYDTRVEIEVAADGRVTDCQVIEARYARPLSGFAGIPNMCEIYRPDGGPRFQVDSASGAIRRGQLRNTLYLRTGNSVVDS